MALPQGRTLEGEIGADLYAELAKVCDTLAFPKRTGQSAALGGRQHPRVYSTRGGCWAYPT
jgi:hypothetical protein